MGGSMVSNSVAVLTGRGEIAALWIIPAGIAPQAVKRIRDVGALLKEEKL
jgi:hypothetical protein